jgi:hypothetical protein
MNWFPGIRALALLRRIARTLERLTEALETIARCTLSDWERDNVKRKGIPNTKFGLLDTKEAEDHWRKQREERMES